MSGVATESAAGRRLRRSSWRWRRSGWTLLARHSHRRSERYRTAGFTYLAQLDAWECPEGEQLHRVETDHAAAAGPLPGAGPRLQRLPAEGRLHRLRPRPRGNPRARPLAALRGRALPPRDRRGDGRLRDAGDLRRRALHHGPADLAVLDGAAASALAGLYLLADFRSTPSGFPWPEGERSGATPPGRQADQRPVNL